MTFFSQKAEEIIALPSLWNKGSVHNSVHSEEQSNGMNSEALAQRELSYQNNTVPRATLCETLRNIVRSPSIRESITAIFAGFWGSLDNLR